MYSPLLNWSNENTTCFIERNEWNPCLNIESKYPGLQYLVSVDHLIIKNKYRWSDVIKNNSPSFVIKDENGQHLYHTRQESTFCNRFWRHKFSPFQIFIYDNSKFLVMIVKRNYQNATSHLCSSSCQEIEIQAPPGQLIGFIKPVVYNNCYWIYEISDEERNVQLRIDCFDNYCLDYGEYPVLSSSNDNEIGKIIKQKLYWTQEMLVKSKNFEVNFPIDLDIKFKALLLAAVFVINYMVYEN
uniref:Phospholipid scramblase n=1 Tax=Dugesia japonica TaxID=6161 RepID=A0A1L5BV33_DUGJA|nr:phospholipid scramblase [Dugesia japonica]